MSTLFALLLLSLTISVVLAAQSSHNQLRRFYCSFGPRDEHKLCSIDLEKIGDPTDTETESIPPGYGCFEQQIHNQTRVYCPMFCEKASGAYIISKSPNNNNKCLKHFNYNVERQEKDGEWFFWRSAPCLSEEIRFDAGCQFDFFSGAIRIKDIARKAIAKFARV